MFCGAFIGRMKPELTTNWSSIVMPITLIPGVCALCSTLTTMLSGDAAPTRGGICYRAKRSSGGLFRIPAAYHHAVATRVLGLVQRVVRYANQ